MYVSLELAHVDLVGTLLCIEPMASRYDREHMYGRNWFDRSGEYDAEHVAAHVTVRMRA